MKEMDTTYEMRRVLRMMERGLEYGTRYGRTQESYSRSLKRLSQLQKTVRERDFEGMKALLKDTTLQHWDDQRWEEERERWKGPDGEG